MCIENEHDPTGISQPMPERPKPPECRILYESPFGPIRFITKSRFDAWKLEPWWKRYFVLSKYTK